MKNLLFLFILFSCQFTFAADDGDWWIERQISISKGQDGWARVNGTSARIIRENASISSKDKATAEALIRRSVAVDIPTASKVGTPMMARIKAYAKVPGVQMIGVAAVMGLIEGIGWVMEEGTYVKHIKSDDTIDPTYSYQCLGSTNNSISKSLVPCAQSYATDNNLTFISCGSFKPTTSYQYPSCTFRYPQGNYSGFVVATTVYDPKEPEPDQTVPLTPALLGAAMLGQGYTDPDPNFNNASVNTGKDTGVKEVYEHDPSGVGNEVAEDMDYNLRNAPHTPYGQTAPYPTPGYDSVPLSPGDDSANRSWTEDGGTASGESTPQKDPVTGEDTGGQSISLQFPLFCSWASKMCQWYDDWKESDQVYKDHMTKTEEHQTEEKSFWSWFQKDDVPNNEKDLEVEDDNQLPQLSTDTFNFGGMCPADINLPIPDPFGHSNNLTLSFQTFCLWLTKLNPWIDVLGWIIAITILTGQRSANNEQ